jgi:hypothetical protein
MSDPDNLMDLSEAREARKMRELLNQLDETWREYGIETDSYMGREHALIKLSFEQFYAMISEDRIARQEDREHYLQMTERLEDAAETYNVAAKDQLAKVDRAARKAEADTKRRELDLQDSAATLIERLSSDLIASVKEGNVLRVRAINQDRFAKWVFIGVLAVLSIFGVGVLYGRHLATPPVFQQSNE